MEIPKHYNPADIEQKWYQYWMDKGFFNSDPDDRKPYTITIPPPNVTGILHMGHVLNNTIQDVLIRRKRMQGYNACWVPGTDHASIATEAKVVALLKSQGIDKKSISREKFLEHAFEWKEKYGGIILSQLKRMGCSCDWRRTTFTMDKDYYADVISVFVDLYNKGLIYRGIRMVNWDPQALTAVSDEEVIYKENQSLMCYVKYKYAEGEGHLLVATVRPETIMGDVAVAVHPDDERYKHLHGKKVIVPLVNRAVPVITDEAIDMSFGTGCLKVTPAHDIVDYEIGMRHKLSPIDVFNDNGTISEAAQVYIGLDRFEARKKAIEDLQSQGLMEKIEPYTNQVGTSERTGAVIEPRLSLQWFLKMQELTKPALEVVLNGEVRLIPNKFINTYKHWMENVRDWCLSRQLWWGHRIPAWYAPDGTIFVAKNLQELEAKLDAENEMRYEDMKRGEQGPKVEKIVMSELKQDEDVLDTWASSWLWPISVFKGISHPENPEIKYYYPTNDLVTAPEILFFWVARMIMAGKEYKNEIPFKNVYLTGIVRDKQRRKMSKSLGNSPDPLELMDKYSADGVRAGMLFCSAAGNDLMFDESLCKQGSEFTNKIWNVFRLVNMWQTGGTSSEKRAYETTAIVWMKEKLAEQAIELNKQFDDFRISEALMNLYKLIWDDFCSWYLEMVKPAYGEKISDYALQESIHIFEELMQLLHPFMPHITEEVWHLLKERSEKDCIIVAQLKDYQSFNSNVVTEMDEVLALITAVRNFRQEKNISPKEALELTIVSEQAHIFENHADITKKMLNLSSLSLSNTAIDGAFRMLVKTHELFIPLSSTVDVEAEKEKIQTEMTYLEGFKQSVLVKLNNEQFVAKAKPELVEKERKKLEDTEIKLKALQESLDSLN